MKKIYLFLLLTAIGFSSFAQTAADYQFIRTTGTYSSISGSGTELNTGGTYGAGIEDDDATVTGIPIGFTFNYCGVNYTTLSACSNGWVSFANSSSTIQVPSAGNIPGSGFIFPFWYDLEGNCGPNRAYYQTTGTSGNRVFTIEFKDFDAWPCVGYAVNFQVKLFEGTNIIQFVYGGGASPTTAAIGISSSTSIYQRLATTTATSTTSSGFSSGSVSLPATNTILQWCPPGAVPTPSGNSAFCAGSTITLSDAAGSGTWASASTSVATIGSSTGVVTGVSSGTSTITFTSAATGCNTTTTVTVNALPAVPTGSTPFCAGSTITLSDAAGAGTWASGNTSVATVGSTGVVTGVSAGTAPITYTAASTGCTITGATVTVNPLPSSISGSFSVCVGSTTALSDLSSGGTWASSNIAQATVGSTGVVTAIAAGNPVISYTASGCSATQTITINPVPGSITGTFTVCPLSTTSLADAASPGGTWSSSDITLATIGSSGVVTAVAGGTPTITYTLSTGCFTTAVVTVSPMAPIMGSLGVCSSGVVTTLTDATPSGVWSSSNPSVATIGSSSGVVTSGSPGTSTISYVSSSLGCTATAVFGVTAAPNVYAVSGGGGYCTGGYGVTIGMAGSDVGVSYQLYRSGVAVGAPVSGAGVGFNFPGLYPTTGSYTVTANPGSSCATNMSGSASVVINSLPTTFTVTGGGNYCSGGSGVHVGLSSSTIGVNYQLYNGGTAVGTAAPGTSAALDFGSFTATGVYTVVATNASTGCVSNMSGSATVGTNPLPTAFTVTGGGSYCTGGSGDSVGLSGSQSGVNYQLLYNGVSTGSPVSGTGAAISFGRQTSPGTYTVVATNTTTSCTKTMTSSVTVSVNPLPTVYSVTGGGAYCSGGTGVHIGLSSSASGVNYQIFSSTTAGATVPGTGVALDFGLFTGAGSYTIVATNATTACTLNMTGSASVSINPLPLVFSVTGGGGYCAGGSGVHVGLSNSEPGITYQLYNATTLWDAATGAGAAIDFGLETAAGVYTIVATNGVTGCTSNMTGSATVVINPLPIIFSVTGGGSYCAGGTGVHVGLAGSSSGVSYQPFIGSATSGSAVGGTGIAIDFGLKTAGGSYTVVATNNTTGCTSIMSGSASVVINPLPPLFTITGNGGYCAGSSGTHLGLSGSTSGYSYQLNLGTTLSGSPMGGTGFPLDFGLRTVSGTYTVVSTNNATGCFTTMTGSVTVSVNPLPTAYLVTGGGPYCVGGTGVHIGLNNSSSTVRYRLFRGTTPVGSAILGNGSSLDFGLQTLAGTYTVVATDTNTLCVNTMSGSATVSINNLPAAFTVTGGGGYCAGGTGSHIGLSASTSGVSYQLMNGATSAGLPVPGTGGALDFGPQTAAGTYTVIATNTSTLCSNTMTGSAVVSINSLPTPYAVTGGGNYCFGTSGSAVGLANSSTGINYQLMLGTTPVGAPVVGTGGVLNFGLQTAVGTYTVIATNTATGCTANMSGGAAVNISTLPVVETVTGGGNYCPGGTGVHVGLNTTENGVSYQLFNGASPVSTLTGVGSSLDFGLQTTPGTYTVRATNPATTCSDMMTGSATVAISSLPVAYNVTGSGNYCPSGTGVDVSLSGSDAGVTYQLYNAFGTVGVPVPGTGIALDFGPQLAGTYTVVATSTITTCVNNMSGSAVINISPLPTLHTVTGGGTYCAGGTGVSVGLDGSDAGIHYQLYKGTAPVGAAMAGTGSALNFGLQTAAGTYTVTALSTLTTCSAPMTGSANVVINALPAVYTVTGGGNYCVGGTGVHIGLSGSTSGVSYQLYRGSIAAGLPANGTGAGIDFGTQTIAGTYTVVATNTGSGCINNMGGSVNVVVSALPVVYTVSGGGNYCSGGSGVHVMLSGSNTGVSYQLLNTSLPTGTVVGGTGFGLDFGAQTAAGNYQVKAVDATTGCVNLMTGVAPITVNPLPNVYPVSSTTSNYCAGGAGVDIYLNTSEAGVNYQLYLGTSPVGSALPGTGSSVNFGYQLPAGVYTVAATNATTTCSTNMSSSVSVVIDALPTAYNVTGGGSYCSGTSGARVGLSGSDMGLSYQLYVDGSAVGGPVTGTGAALDFGAQSTTGTYSVIATNAMTTCTNNMSGTVNVSIASLPGVYVMTGGGTYCAGGSGVHIGLTGSQSGFRYQLYNGFSPAGSAIVSAGGPLDLGSVTAAGTYTVLAIDPSTSCTNTMLGTESVSVDPLPTAYPVTGGGNYCPGGVGVHIGVSGSHSGVSYQLFNGSVPAGSAMTGSGPAIDFGLQTVSGTYTVVGTDALGCSSTMSGTATVGLNTLPSVFNVNGGGNYCSGTAGVHVGLNGSQTGISYQLKDGVVAIGSPIPGTGGILDFGLQTLTTTYTVVATNTSTSCASNMAGSATVTETASVVPIVNITPVGSTLCSGNFTTFTAVPTNGGTAPVYQWSVNGVVTGTSVSYGYIPLNGDVLSVSMTSNATCASPTTTSDSRMLTVEAVGAPSVTIAAYPGNEVCQGTSVNFGAMTSFAGSAPTYTWMLNNVAVGGSSNYNYTPANGDDLYLVITSNYQCRTGDHANSNHIHMIVDLPGNPSVTVTSSAGNSVVPGQTVVFTANVTGGGTAPMYQWSVNGLPMPGATTQMFTTNTLSDGDMVACEVTRTDGCAGMNGSGSLSIHVSNVSVKPVVAGSGDLKLMPNPNKGTFIVKGSLGTGADESAAVEVTDMIGQVIYTGTIKAQNGEVNERINLGGSVANGMYIMTIHTTAGNNVFHVIVEQ